MAWMPYSRLQKAVLNNRHAGRVIGWARLAGMDRLVLIDLEGNFAADICGQTVVLLGPESSLNPRSISHAGLLMSDQTGKVVLMTAGRDPAINHGQPCFVWETTNGPVVWEPPADRIWAVGEFPIPFLKHVPVENSHFQLHRALARRTAACR